jgi:hypothetical protein
MTDDVLEPIEGIEVLPAWNDGEGNVFLRFAEGTPYDETFQSRALRPAEARALARHLTLAAEIGEQQGVNRPD